MNFNFKKIKKACIVGCFIMIVTTMSSCSVTDTLTKYIKDTGTQQEEPKLVPTISENLYVYEQLSEETKIVYDQIVQLLSDHNEAAFLSTIEQDIAKKAFHAVLADHPEIFWVNSYTLTSYYTDDVLESLKITPDYTMTPDERKEYQIQVEEYAAQCLSGISDGDSDYTKAKYIYDYIIKHTDYVEGSVHNQNICSVMAHQASVCMGYARTMQYLLKEAGILSVTVSGDTEEGSHAWNLVCLDNEYYYIDPTWGDMQFEGEHSLNMDVDYSYFAITTEELLRSHTPDSDFQLAECTSKDCNYYVREGLYLEEFSTDTLEQIINNRSTAGIISIKCSDGDVYNQLKDFLLTEGHIYDYIDGNSVNYVEMEELNILSIQLQE